MNIAIVTCVDVMRGNVIVDGRNIYDRQELKEQGFVYTRIGEQ